MGGQVDSSYLIAFYTMNSYHDSLLISVSYVYLTNPPLTVTFDHQTEDDDKNVLCGIYTSYNFEDL